jgi:hypothetical protein
MMALWRLVSLGHASYAESNQSVLEALTDNASSSDPPIAFSVITIVKALVAKSLPLATKPVIQLLLPPETVIILPPDSDRRDRTFLFDRIREAHIALLSEFLEACRPDFIPYQAVETLHFIAAKNLEPHAAVHETQQVRLANGIPRIYHLDFPRGSELLDALISSKIFKFAPYFRSWTTSDVS